MSKSSDKKRKLFKDKHPEGRKAFAKAKREAKKSKQPKHEHRPS